MTKFIDSYEGQEFEVTEADVALVSPMGTPGGDDREWKPELAEALKEMLDASPYDLLPHGRWDAFIDEGDSQCGVADCPDGDHCCNGDHHVVTRASSTQFDNVFVRLHTDAVPEPIWDVEVLTRNGRGQVLDAAIPTINSEEYTPEALITDLGTLLAVFRLYVNQGKI